MELACIPLRGRNSIVKIFSTQVTVWRQSSCSEDFCHSFVANMSFTYTALTNGGDNLSHSSNEFAVFWK